MRLFSFSNGEKISSLFDEIFLIEYELKKAGCSGLHAVFFQGSNRLKIAVQMRKLFFERYLVVLIIIF